jgi:hypothetical protein
MAFFFPDTPFDPNKHNIDEFDVLKFNDLASNLAQYLAEQKEKSISIGIFGAWGSGKTSLMRMIKKSYESLSEPGIRKTVWFNAWRYDHDENPVIPLLKCIEKQVFKVSKKDNQFGKIAKALLSTTSIEWKIPLSGLTLKVNPNTGIDSFQANSTPDHLDRLADLRYFDMEEALSEEISGNIILPIVIFIDDLDRCTPENALKIIDATKAIFDIGGYSFIVGIDPASIRGWLRNKFGLTNDYDPDCYLAKIFQVMVPVPIGKNGIDNLIDNICDNQKDNQNILIYEEIKNWKEYFLTVAGITPRHIYQIINMVNLLLLQNFNKNNIANCILLIIIKVRWPLFFSFLSESPKTRADDLEYYGNHFSRGELSEILIKHSKDNPSFNKMKSNIENDHNLRDFLINNLTIIVSGIKEFNEIFTAMR